jgi:hypothetical protein
MTSPGTTGPTPAKRRRLIVWALLRSLAATVVLVALYYLLPLDRIPRVPLGVIVAIGLAVLAAVTIWQVRSIISARYPAVRAVEALAAAVPLFLLLFASTYYVMARTSPASFAHQLTRTDALYFTVTTFSTVGYGDIAPATQSARLVVTSQIILDGEDAAARIAGPGNRRVHVRGNSADKGAESR